MPVSLMGNPQAFLRGAGGSGFLPQGPTGPPAQQGQPGQLGGLSPNLQAAMNPQLLQIANQVLQQQRVTQYRTSMLTQVMKLLKRIAADDTMSHPEAEKDIRDAMNKLDSAINRYGGRSAGSQGSPLGGGSVLAANIMKSMDYKPPEQNALGISATR